MLAEDLRLLKWQENLHVTGWEKRRKESKKGIGMGPATLGGSYERGKVPATWEAPSPAGRSAKIEGELQSL